jgi:hypothetical protein
MEKNLIEVDPHVLMGKLVVASARVIVFVVRRIPIMLVWLLLPGMTSCILPAQKLDLSTSRECPEVKWYRRVAVEGYFGIDPKKGVSTEGGFENVYPFSRFAFSAKPGVDSKLEAAVVRANEGNNGPEIANRTEFRGSGDQATWHLFDEQGREIGFGDRVRITGPMIRECVIKADRIERL